MRKLLVVASMMFLGVGSAQAAGRTTEQAIRGSGAYGSAGCGLGSMAFGNQPGAVQILAATTNGTSGNQTFGITTGTSNCGQAVWALNGTKVFIEGNKEALAKDAARGQGETIVVLRHIAGCQADSQAVGAALQQNWGKLFPSANAPTAQVRDNVIQLLRTDKALGCQLG
jgi:hypothetical protein